MNKSTESETAKFKKSPLIFLVFLLAIVSSVNGQEKPPGKSIIKVFGNFHKGITEDDRSTAFEIKRVYLGYKHNIDDHFSAEVKLDIGSPEDLSEYSLIRRYAYFKTASLTYRKNNLTIWSGLFDMRMFKEQESFWGYRYIYKSFQDEYKFGSSADIGVGARYKFNRFLSADLTITNGEGYKNLQADNSYRTGAGLSLYPNENSIFRLYYDFLHNDITQSTYSAFIAYRFENFRIGAEYNYEQNYNLINNHDLFGYSIYGTYIFNEKWEVFGRYDKLSSSIDDSENLPWNIYKDGSAIISGIQFHPTAGVKLSLNYKDWYSFAANGPNRSFIFLNIEFKI